MPTAVSKRRWFHLSPDRFVIGLLFGVCFLWLSEGFQWFGFNHHKGWTVLIAAAAVGVAALVMLLWWAAGLIFRWRFQFGIRSVLAFCLACSIAAGWLAVEMRLAKRQAEVVDAIANLGVDGVRIGIAEHTEPGWLVKLLGQEFFEDVLVLEMARTNTMDAELVRLSCLGHLQLLDLRKTEITDAGLVNLKGLSRLGTLLIGETKITDAGLERLKGLTQLQRVDLRLTRVTPAGVKKLQQALPNCTIIH